MFKRALNCVKPLKCMATVFKIAKITLTMTFQGQDNPKGSKQHQK